MNGIFLIVVGEEFDEGRVTAAMETSRHSRAPISRAWRSTPREERLTLEFKIQCTFLSLRTGSGIGVLDFDRDLQISAEHVRRNSVISMNLIKIYFHEIKSILSMNFKDNL